MKACIVTVYDSLNCGSYWQAFVLGRIVSRLGYEVVYKKRDQQGETSSSRKKQFRVFLSHCVHGRLPMAARYLASVTRFTHAQYRFSVVTNNADIDCFILGSDTIWNLDSRFFLSHAKTYWGMEFFPKKVISYAASAANTEGEMITAEMHGAIGKMYAVSVRDKHTYRLICRDTDKVQLVGDPTLLFTKEDYLEYVKKNREQKGYVFLYLNEPLSPEHAAELKEFCKEKVLRIINGLTWDKPAYCDKSITVEPENYLTYMYYADYIITDTFHGSVFSVNFNKRFASLDKGKNKVFDFLESVGLEDRLANRNESLIDKMTLPVDYAKVDSILDQIRNTSLSFLENALKDC